MNLFEYFDNKDEYDIIIGNPPYLKERDNKMIFEIVNKSNFGKKYHQGKMDYWFYFLHKAIELVKINGIISYITPRYWLNSTGASKLIEHIKKELFFLDFVDIGKLKIFDEVVGQHMIAIYKKKHYTPINDLTFFYKRIINNLSDIEKNSNTPNIQITILSNKSIFTEDNEIILRKLFYSDKNIEKLGDITEISQGVVEAPDRISKKQLNKICSEGYYIGQGIFVLSTEEIYKLKLNDREKSVIKKYLDPCDVKKYHISFNDKYLIYSDKTIKEKIQCDKNYQHLKKHLDKFKIFITSSNKPYGLHRPREEKFFNNQKIIFKNMFKNPEFTIDEKNNYYFGFSFSSIIHKSNQYNLKYILAILNSTFAKSWFFQNGKHRGIGVDIGVKKLRTFPIKQLSFNHQYLFTNIVDRIIRKKERGEDTLEEEEIIDIMVYKLYELSYDEVKIIDSDFRLNEEEYENFNEFL